MTIPLPGKPDVANCPHDFGEAVWYWYIEDPSVITVQAMQIQRCTHCGVHYLYAGSSPEQWPTQERLA